MESKAPDFNRPHTTYMIFTEGSVHGLIFMLQWEEVPTLRKLLSLTTMFDIAITDNITFYMILWDVDIGRPDILHEFSPKMYYL